MLPNLIQLLFTARKNYGYYNERTSVRNAGAQPGTCQHVAKNGEQWWDR
jgi:hypothetical protein